MSDALASNQPSHQYKVHHCLCNSHGRRQFAEVLHQFPDEVEQVLKWYGEIWDNEDEIRAQGLNGEKRLVYHKAHSLPMMEHIRDWGHDQLVSGVVEESSGLGKAIQLDNNRAEQALKLVARNRKNAMFHKTQAGASIDDVVMSMIATSVEAGINVFDYFNTLQRRHKEVKADPEQFLPWNYHP